ncbi:hypothetical protein EK21DRAFT_70845 [Setomelanomma holmii]|uniref:AB hydrolase-1 domain-containing protein n=1 Tax=Setomelanomma holmii TaxID=210430 RepID=A0A9P4LKU1_9PLEO|nr:hypothetical protein EK21DRAFT_70845 [Setomelanomma holmii]
MPSHLLSILLAATPVLSLPFQYSITQPAPTPSIQWSDCSAYWYLSQDLQCGNLSVPIDWSNPTSSHFTLRLVRLPRPSNSTLPRLGSLFINPGGPGGSAVSDVSAVARGMIPAVSSDVLNSFDIIGVDPRGVALSVTSLCDASIWDERVSLFPKTRKDYDRLVDKNKRLGKSCLNITGDVIEHVDTISAAKDHEAVRAALGDEMNWLGLSYGSMLGAQYAQLYPEHLRTMVLDGVLQHSLDEMSNIRIETTAYATALESFFEWAQTNNASSLQGQDVEKLWYSILESAAKTPTPAPSCSNNTCTDCPLTCRFDVNEEDILFNAQGFLLSPSTEAKAAFADALLGASQGDASALTTSLPFQGNPSLYAGLTIGCQDWTPKNASFEDFQEKMRKAAEVSPLTKGASQTWTLQASCVGWPAPPQNPPKKLDVKASETILLVNSLKDPSTGYEWAIGMQDEIEKNVLLTRKGDGHTSYTLGGATTEAINRYLLTKELPAPGTVLDS